MKEVAKHAQVAPSTVSYVLNNVPGQVRADVRERVLRSIKELGYRPNGMALALRRGTANTIGS